MAAYFAGLTAPNGGAGLAMTLAFATLTLSRLFHGFNCRGEAPLFHLGLASNPYSVMAFIAGTVFLLMVLLIPGLTGLFTVSPFTYPQLGLVFLLALAPTVVIQLWKLCRR